MPMLLINVLGKVIAEMGMMLLSERVVRKVTIVTLEALKEKASNQHVKDYIQVLIDAWKLPPLSAGAVTAVEVKKPVE